MNAKARIDSVLFQLNPEQQAQVYDWIQTIGYEKTRQRLAEPPPQGFEIATHLASLRRFFVRYSALLHRANPIEELETPLSPQALQVAENALHLGAVELSANPGCIDSFKLLSRWVARQKDHALKQEFLANAQAQLALSRERLALDREKFEFNAARAALNHHVELGNVLDNNETDNEDKILQARAILFNRPISDLPK